MDHTSGSSRYKAIRGEHKPTHTRTVRTHTYRRAMTTATVPPRGSGASWPKAQQYTPTRAAVLAAPQCTPLSIVDFVSGVPRISDKIGHTDVAPSLLGKISTHREYPGRLLPPQSSDSWCLSLPLFTIGKGFLTIVCSQANINQGHRAHYRTPPYALATRRTTERPAREETYGESLDDKEDWQQ